MIGLLADKLQFCQSYNKRLHGIVCALLMAVLLHALHSVCLLCGESLALPVLKYQSVWTLAVDSGLSTCCDGEPRSCLVLHQRFVAVSKRAGGRYRLGVSHGGFAASGLGTTWLGF